MAYLSIVTPAITTSAYAAGDALGAELEFGGVPKDGFIQSLCLTDDAKQDAQIDLYLFSDDITTGTDNAAYTMAAADQPKLIGRIAIAASDYSDVGGHSEATIKNIALPFVSDVSNLKYRIYGQCVIRGAATYGAVDDIQIRLGILSDRQP